MVAGNVCTTPDGVRRAFSPPTPNIDLPRDNSVPAWLSRHSFWVLGSVLGMFASTVFLCVFRNGGLRAFWHVPLRLLSSRPLHIGTVTVAALHSIRRTHAWTCQLARHIYLLGLCALCQAFILPCLAGSQLLRWAGHALFGTLRVLHTALRVLFKIVFNTLVVDTGLGHVFVVASKTVTSYLWGTWNWTTDVHDAVIHFVGGSKSTALALNPLRGSQCGRNW